MSAAREKRKPVPYDDDQSAAVFVRCLASRTIPSPEILARLDPTWGDGVDFVAETIVGDPLAGWLDRVAGAHPDRIEAIRSAVEMAVEAEATADAPSDDVVDRWPVLDPLAYHGIAGEIVAEADPHTEADPVAILVQFLVAFANAVGRKPHWVAGATRHYLSLYAAMVGATASGRKGSSWGVVRYFVGDLDESWANDRITQGLSTGEGLIYHVRDSIERQDEDGEIIVEDPGVEDKRLLAIESELARTLRVMSRESNTLSAILRQAWDCDQRLATLTKNSANVATGSHVSVIGHITRDELHSLMSNTESANGFGNRFLWVCVRRSKELPDGGDFYSQPWGGIIQRLRDVFGAAREVDRMVRDDEAAELWRDVYGDLSGGKPGLLGAMLARAEAQVMRLACVYALLDGSAVVRAPHLRAALALWEYCEASARYVFGDSLADPQAEKLVSALRATPAGMKRSEISSKVFSNHLEKDKLGRLLQDQLSLGLIHRVVTPSTGGRPAELWFAGRAKRGAK